MSFFYDLNKRLANLASKQDAKQISEDAKATAPKSRLAESMDMAEAGNASFEGTFDLMDAAKDFAKKWIKRYPGNPNETEAKHPDEYEKFANAWVTNVLNKNGIEVTPVKLEKSRSDFDYYLKQEYDMLSESKTKSYSAKNAAAGKDIGKPGKNFKKIADKSSPEVAGAVLNKLRHPSESTGMTDEGNAFTGALAKTPKGQNFALGGKKFKDTSSIEEAGLGNDLRDHVLAVLETIYKGAVAGEEMIDDVADELGDHFTAVKRSGDKTLKQAYSLMRQEGGEAEGNPQLMASIAKKAIGMLSSIEEVGKAPMTTKQKSFAKLAPPADKISFADRIAGAKKEVDEMLGDVAAEAIKSAVGGKKKQPRSAGTAFDPEYMKQQQVKKDAESHSRYDVTDTGYSKRYTRKAVDTDIDAGDEVKSDEPKRRGRPKGKDKGPERVTAKSYKYKAGRPTKTKEGLDSDGVMMTQPSNMSSESADMEGSRDRNEAGEFGAEGDYVKNELHTMVRVARDLEKHLRDNEDLPTWCIGKLSQAKGMVVSVMDYIMSEKERGVEAATGREGVTMEKAPPGAKAERMVKHIKAGYAKDGKVTPKEKSIAYATAWKAKKAGKVEEESTDREDQKAERAGKKVAKDIEHDEGHKGKDDAKAERAGKKVTKDIEYDDAKDKKEKKVAETTKSGYNFGGSVYESLNNKFNKALTETMNISINMNAGEDGETRKSITVSAEGDDADKLAELLKMAGLSSQAETCSGCGHTPCDCGGEEEMVDENTLDWPTKPEYTSTQQNMDPVSNDLNRDKSTGQTTIPVVASQLRRQVSMEENVQLEKSLFKLYQNYKGK